MRLLICIFGILFFHLAQAQTIEFGGPQKNSEFAQSLFMALSKNYALDIFLNSVRIYDPNTSPADVQAPVIVDLGVIPGEWGRCQKRTEPLVDVDGLALPGGPEFYFCAFNQAVYSEGAFNPVNISPFMSSVLQSALRLDFENGGPSQFVQMDSGNFHTRRYFLEKSDGKLVCEFKFTGNFVTVETYTCSFSK
jgi:hypothetical protein